MNASTRSRDVLLGVPGETVAGASGGVPIPTGAGGSSSRPAAGFSFLELLVALAILGSAFVILLGAHSSAARVESRARRLMTASLLAREILTDTEVQGFPDLGGDEGDFGEEFPGYTWRRDVVTPILPIPVTSVEVREVHISVSWPDRGATESTELVLYGVRPL